MARTRSSASCDPAAALASSDALSTTTCIDGVSSEHEYPIIIAVSCLSPVRTQTRIPASRSVASAYGTPSWSLSSIAVAPTKTRSVSSASYNDSSADVRAADSADDSTSWYSAYHSDHHRSESSRLAATSVRSPSVANRSKCACVAL